MACVDAGDVVLAVAWGIVEARKRRGLRDEAASLYDLSKVLARLQEMGVKLGLRFIEYSFGPYSPDLEPLLEKLAESGRGEYIVEIHVPHTPSRVDPDYAWAIIEHQWSERDADRKYVRKRFIPRARPSLPSELAEAVRKAVESYVEAQG